MPDSIRWGMTSVSVSERKLQPCASSSMRSSRWFSTMPLWMTAISPLQSVWGWALSWVARPWVAQRVWPIPAPVALSADGDLVAQVGELAGVLGGSQAPSTSMMAMPALS